MDERFSWTDANGSLSFLTDGLGSTLGLADARASPLTSSVVAIKRKANGWIFCTTHYHPRTSASRAQSLPLPGFMPLFPPPVFGVNATGSAGVRFQGVKQPERAGGASGATLV